MVGKEVLDSRIKEIIEKYNINLEKLKQEQLKLAKNLEIRDSIDFELAERIAGIENVFFKNNIISAVTVMIDEEIVEEEYFTDKVRFPYLPGFRAYRELPSMIGAVDKLEEKPDLIFVSGHGIMHPRGLGIASHLALSAGIPAIGIADSLLVGEVRGEDILLEGKIVGKFVYTKPGSRHLYISPGNFISVKTAAELVKKFTREPHKLPEPLRLARRYAKNIRKELFKAGSGLEF